METSHLVYGVKPTHLDKVIARMKELGYKDWIVKQHSSLRLFQKTYHGVHEVIATGSYEGRSTVIRIVFSHEGKFLNFRLETRGVDWTGYAKTIGTLMNDDGLLGKLSPTLNREREARREQERKARQAQQDAEVQARAEQARADFVQVQHRFEAALLGAIEAEGYVIAVDNVIRITDALLDSGVLEQLAQAVLKARVTQKDTYRIDPSKSK